MTIGPRSGPGGERPIHPNTNVQCMRLLLPNIHGVSRRGRAKDIIPHPLRSPAPEQMIEIQQCAGPAVFADEVGEDGGLLEEALQCRGGGFA